MENYLFIDLFGNLKSTVKANNKAEAVKKNGGIFHNYEFCIPERNLQLFQKNVQNIKL